MTTDSIRNTLKRLEGLGVPKNAVSIGNMSVDNQYVIAEEGGEWIVYYAERGGRWDERHFPSETDAGRYLVGWLIDSVLQWWKPL